MMSLLPTPWAQLAASMIDTQPVITRAIQTYLAKPKVHSTVLALLILTAQLKPKDAQLLLDTLDSPDQDVISSVILARIGDIPAAISLLDGVIDRLRARDEDINPWVLAELGRSLAVSGNVIEGAAILEEALLLARAWNDPVCAGRCLLQLGFIEGERNHPINYAARTQEAILQLREGGDLRGEMLGLCNLGGALQSLGDDDAAGAAYEKAFPIVKQYGWAYHEALILAGRAGLAYRRKAVEYGATCYAESEKILDQIGNHQQTLYQRMVWGRTALASGQPTEALKILALFFLESGTSVPPDVAAQAWGVQAMALEALGNYAEACAARAQQVSLLEKTNIDRIAIAQIVAAERHQNRLTNQVIQVERNLRFELEERNVALSQALQLQERLRKDLEILSITDMLTSLFNRRHLENELQKGLQLARRHRQALSLILIDIDRFKSINDRYGHAIGDQVLIAVSARLRSRARVTDTVARWGGEEFCLVLPNTMLQGAAAFAEELRLTIRTSSIDTDIGPISVTVSLGVVSVELPDETPSRLLRRADTALYAAKTAGRDCVICYKPSLPSIPHDCDIG